MAQPRFTKCKSDSRPPLHKGSPANGLLVPAGITRFGPRKDFLGDRTSIQFHLKILFFLFTFRATWLLRILLRSKPPASLPRLRALRAAKLNMMLPANRTAC